MRTRIRVLKLTADYPPDVWSGIGNSVASQASALCKIGLEVQVLVAGSDQHYGATPTVEGLNIQPLSKYRCPVDLAKFDLLHLHSLPLSELAIEIKQRYGIPLIYTSHSIIEREFAGEKDMQFWVKAQRHLWQVSDHVVFVSSAEKSRAIACVPHLANRTSVIPNGVLMAKRPLSEQLKKRPIVFVGRFAQIKGIDLLLDIIRRLAPRGYPFVLAGGHGDESWEQNVGRIALQFPDHCRLAGWLDRKALDRLYAQAAIVLIPSRYEPFGLVALEAMRSGAPVLAAAVDGLSEVIQPESGGRLVSSRDPDAWCAEILNILSTPALSCRLRQSGPRYVSAYFEPKVLARRLVKEVYRPSITDQATPWMDKPPHFGWEVSRQKTRQFQHMKYPLDV